MVNLINLNPYYLMKLTLAIITLILTVFSFKKVSAQDTLYWVIRLQIDTKRFSWETGYNRILSLHICLWN